MAELGIIAPQGIARVADLMAVLLGEDTTNVPALAREALRGLAAELEALGRRVKEIEVAIVRWHKDNEASRRLAAIPGVGPITAFGDRRHYYRPFSVPLRSAPCGLDRAGAQTAQQRRQTAPRGDLQTGLSLPAPTARAGCNRGDPVFAKQIHSRGRLAHEPAQTPARP